MNLFFNSWICCLVFAISILDSSSIDCGAASTNGIKILINPTVGFIISVVDSGEIPIVNSWSISLRVVSSSSNNRIEFSSSSISFSKTSDSL